MLHWRQVTKSTRILAEAYDAPNETIYVRFIDCVEWLFEECPLEIWEAFTRPEQSRGAFIADVLNLKPNRPRARLVEVRSVERIGQLTGSTRQFEPTWRRAEDPLKWPLLNDTGRVGVMGVDLGAHVEHSDGRTYFFFGDVAIEQDEHQPGFNGEVRRLRESDLVAWTDEKDVLRHGGHLGMGFNFFLPNNEEGATATIGQPDWRFCVRCGALFFAGPQSTGSVCPKGGEHSHANVGKVFFLPIDRDGSNRPGGQTGWRRCRRCEGLFHSPERQPGGACPAGGEHRPDDVNFSLPNQRNDPDDPQEGETPGPRPSAGQPDWRFCIYCGSLFWSGSAFKGLCPGARGGGFHLHAVVRDAGDFKGKFAPLRAENPIGYTQTFETPTGAFSHDGRVYVFVGITFSHWSRNDVRPGEPACGLYLVSNDNPSSPGRMTDRHDHFTPTYRKEFLVSPRLGWCPRDDSRTVFESHEILGHRFTVTSEPGGTIGDVNHWRLCRKCESIYWNDGVGRPCWKGGHHENDVDAPLLILHEGSDDSPEQQSHWRRCVNCAMLFFEGSTTGRCPFGGDHQRDNSQAALLIAFLAEDKDAQETRVDNGPWRFCVKCHGMVQAEQIDVFSMAAACAVDNDEHDLPQRDGRGVVLMTRSWAHGLIESGFRVAWMPLPATGSPRLQDMKYLADEPEGWSDHPYRARLAIPHPSNAFTSASLTWLRGPARWILLYSDNNPDSERGQDAARLGPVMASLSADLRTWCDPFVIFDPRCAHAYGPKGFMHMPKGFTHMPADTMHLDIPPLPVFGDDGRRENRPGCAYGAFLLRRFTTWNDATRDLGLHYLLSTGRPYQVHLMRTTIRLGPAV